MEGIAGTIFTFLMFAMWFTLTGKTSILHVSRRLRALTPVFFLTYSRDSHRHGGTLGFPPRPSSPLGQVFSSLSSLHIHTNTPSLQSSSTASSTEVQERPSRPSPSRAATRSPRACSKRLSLVDIPHRSTPLPSPSPFLLSNLKVRFLMLGERESGERGARTRCSREGCRTTRTCQKSARKSFY